MSREKQEGATYTFAEDKKVIDFTKYNIYTDKRRHDQPKAKGLQILSQVKTKSFKALQEEQQAYLAEFWDVADIEILGDEAHQQGLRFNVYQLL